MKIQNKYLRNRHFRIKNWKRARNTEHPFRTICPFWFQWGNGWSEKDQIKNHFEWIETQARRYENGSHRVAMRNASSSYRRISNAKRKAKSRATLQKIRNGNYELEMPKFKQDAAWNFW